MDDMTSVERVSNLLRRRPVDRIGLYEHFWGDTHKKWVAEGHLGPDEAVDDHFGFDFINAGWFNMVAKLGFEPETIEETEETIVQRDGNGAVMRRHKLHDTTPEHIDFLVRDRAGWEEHIKPFLEPDRRRIDFKGYAEGKARAAERQRFFCLGTTNVFELMHPVCGHQYMLTGMAMDPDWVKDMVNTYAELIVNLMEILFAEEGPPDGVWFYEDMGFKGRPFMSADMYREIVFPGHRRTIGYLKNRGLPVIMHSCGYVEPLIPGMIEAGIDCLQVIEVKAGMDLLKLYRDFGERLSFMGGIDVRVLYSNDKTKVDAELESKVPVVKGHYGYMLHSDHSIPDQVDYETYRYFVDKGLELGRY